MTIRIVQGDCLDVMRTMADNSVDSIVTDPPYGLTSRRPGGRSEATEGAVMKGFMGMAWDGSVPSEAIWREALRVLKPGGYLLAFAGTRTQHRMACRIEDAGFEIRDMIAWVYGSGFPKSLDVSKAIDKAAGAEREFTPRGNAVKRMIPGADQNETGSWIKDNGRQYQPGVSTPATDAALEWEGWGTALKPALEPITVARKPLIGTVAENVLEYGTGALNIDGCRIPAEPRAPITGRGGMPARHNVDEPRSPGVVAQPHDLGRWPANLIHDGSDEVLEAFPQAPGQLADASSSSSRKTQNVYGAMRRGRGDEPSADSENDGAVGFKMRPGARRLDAGSAARFFYCAKASGADRGEGNTHPTAKPTDLMRYLCRLVTPPGGVVLDPFMGSGSTLKAAELEGFGAIGIELSADYVDIARRRIASDAPLFAEVA